MSKLYRVANYYHVTPTITKEAAVHFSLAEIFHDNLWNEPTNGRHDQYVAQVLRDGARKVPELAVD